MPVHFTSFASLRRPTRAQRFSAVPGLMLLLVLASGCATEQTVATDLQLSRLVTGQGVELQVDAAARDALALRGTGASDAEAQGPVGGVAPADPGSEPIATQTTVTAVPSTVAPSAPTPASESPSPLAPTVTTAPASAVPAAAPPTLASSNVPATSPAPGAGDAPADTASPAPSTSTTSRSPAAPAPSVSGPVPATTAPIPPVTEGAEALAVGETRSFTLLGELRAGLGLQPLVRDAELDAFAREWSQNMAESGVFDHSTSPYGENIAFTSNTRLTASEAADVFQRLWVESDVHYQNMTGTYAKVGIGLYRTERGWYGTHAFSY